MRRVIAGTFVSLDGVMQAPGGPEEDPTGGFRFGGWMTAFFDDTLGEAVDGFMNEPFDLLLGRKTYEIFAAHWPYIDDEAPDGGIARKFASARKYVAASPDERLTWENSINIGADLIGEVRRLRTENGPNLLIQGSSDVLHALLAESLIDELTVMIAPVLLGQGKRLFDDGAMPKSLELVSHRVSATGVVIATYRPDGEVHTGSFAMPEPTEAELARRERMSRDA